MSFRKGFTVWVEVADGSWAAAEVAEDGGKVIRALTESGKLVIWRCSCDTAVIFVELWSFFLFCAIGWFEYAVSV